VSRLHPSLHPLRTSQPIRGNRQIADMGICLPATSRGFWWLDVLVGGGIWRRLEVEVVPIREGM
jgi:hypothetical protein